MNTKKLLNMPQKVKKRIMSLIIKRRLSYCGDHFRVSSDFSVVGGQYITIGDYFSANKNVKIHAFKTLGYEKPEIVIGDKVVITDNSYISCINKVTIGNGVLFGVNSFVTDNFHGKNDDYHELLIPPNERSLYSKGPVAIEDNVWVGRNACIMPGVHIGRGAIIGSNAVVTHDVEPFTVVGGIPAKKIKSIARPVMDSRAEDYL